MVLKDAHGTEAQASVGQLSDAAEAQLRLRLRKAEGQVRGIIRMIEADRGCMDVLIQVNATREALRGVAGILLRMQLERIVAASWA